MNEVRRYFFIFMQIFMSFLVTAIGTPTVVSSGQKHSNKEKNADTRQVRQLNKDWRQIVSGLTFGGSFRSRGEVKNHFDFNNSNQDYFLTQLRLNLKWQLGDWFTVFIEGQDARVFGEDITATPSINENATPNIYADNFDLHQGYIDLKFSAGEAPFTIRAGRQKFNFGTMRLVASLEWVNTARVWDGVRVTIGNPKNRKLDAIVSRLVPVNPNRFNDHSTTGSRYFNSGFHGLYLTDKVIIPETQVEVYWLLRHVGSVDDDVHTIGSRFASEPGAIDFNGELAGQFGKFNGLDQRAFMVHFDGGLKVGFLNKSRFGIGYNFATGDGDPNDGSHHTFDNLYPLNHAYYGYMDLISLQNIHNVEATLDANLFKKLKFRVAYQNFWLVKEDNDAWYNAGLRPVRNANGQDVDSHIGSEIDITLKYPLMGGRVLLAAGFSHLFTGNYINDTGTSVDANFAFLMTKINL